MQQYPQESTESPPAWSPNWDNAAQQPAAATATGPTGLAGKVATTPAGSSQRASAPARRSPSRSAVLWSPSSALVTILFRGGVSIAQPGVQAVRGLRPKYRRGGWLCGQHPARSGRPLRNHVRQLMMKTIVGGIVAIAIGLATLLGTPIASATEYPTMPDGVQGPFTPVPKGSRR